MPVEYGAAVGAGCDPLFLELLQVAADRLLRHLEHSAELGHQDTLVLMKQVDDFLFAFCRQHGDSPRDPFILSRHQGLGLPPIIARKRGAWQPYFGNEAGE
ncbi:hypothetical protein D3C81_1447630 [compost metagenome]